MNGREISPFMAAMPNGQSNTLDGTRVGLSNSNSINASHATTQQLVFNNQVSPMGNSARDG